SHHDCPFGTLCVDATCQVVGCGSRNGVAECTGNNLCDGDKCVVGECSAATSNCARGFHCEPVEGPLASISGSCVPDETGVTYCASDTDCIAPGNFNPRCIDGVCGTRRGRGRARCTDDADCFKSCLRSRAAVGIPYCDPAGTCVCGGC